MFAVESCKPNGDEIDVTMNVGGFDSKRRVDEDDIVLDEWSHGDAPI